MYLPKYGESPYFGIFYLKIDYLKINNDIMTLYSKWFDTHNEYEAYKNGLDYILPNVSICYQLRDVHYEKYVRDYSKEYLTFEALEDTVFSIVFTYDSIINQYITQAMRESFSYSIDDGKTWVTFETPNDTYSGIALTTPTIHAGEKVLWKGIGTQNYISGPNAAHCYFTSSGDYIAYGNMMSIIYGDMFINKYDLENTNYGLAHFFYNNTYLISAQNLILPATTLTEGCYSGMFWGCTLLTTVPELPATTLALYCYTSIFNGCTSLTTVPELPATTLALNCYASMFYGCTSLTTAPELPATTLTNNCYNMMFNGCTKLNYIKAMFITTPSNTYTSGWVGGVSATGTFVKSSTATWNVSGNNGIPSGWTVQTASA